MLLSVLVLNTGSFACRLINFLCYNFSSAIKHVSTFVICEQKHLSCIHGTICIVFLLMVFILFCICIYSFFVDSVALCKPWELDDVNGASKPGFGFIRFSFNCTVFVTVV